MKSYCCATLIDSTAEEAAAASEESGALGGAAGWGGTEARMEGQRPGEAGGKPKTHRRAGPKRA